MIPVVASRLLGEALLCTALTRGQEEVMLVRDTELAARVVAEPARVALRLQAVDSEAGS